MSTAPRLVVDHDALLEQRIRKELEAMNHASAHGYRIKAEKHLITMNRLIKERSPEQIARMEEKKGLR